MGKEAILGYNGTDTPSSTSSSSIKRYLKSKKKEQKGKEYYISGILQSDIPILSKSITLLESSLPEHRDLAQGIMEGIIHHSGNSMRIGITGVPGVGKSSFIEALGKYIIEEKHKKLAVLAIDPSSSRSKGSILGDKTRMEFLASHPKAYIRPSPSSGTLGGVASKTREVMLLCEAAGFDTIFVETMGVGQSETTVHSMVDFFLLLLLAGAGDELQGMKRGIIEMADALVITKSDGTNVKNAEKARTAYENALHLFPPSNSGWPASVMTCSAHKGYGMKKIWDTINACFDYVKKADYFTKQRNEQLKLWMYESINTEIKQHFFTDTRIKKQLKKIEANVLQKKISPANASKTLLDLYFHR